MNDIKNALLLLCKEIKSFCNVEIKIEHIRLAKFNEVAENNVEILWQVLHSLCHHLTRKNHDQECSIIFVKHCFASWMYKRIAFYKLPLSGKYGSRELLIALAWLIAKKNIFDKLISHKVWEVERKIKTFENTTDADNMEYKGHTENLTFADNLKYLLLLCGKIKYNLRHISEYDEERIKLVDKVHEETQVIDGVPHLSLDETKLFLQDKPNLTVWKFLAELQTTINTHRKWKEKSCIFWRWMDTVLEKADMDASISNCHENNEALIELIQVMIDDINSKLRDANGDGLDDEVSEGNMYHFPRLIFYPPENQNKPSELKNLTEIIITEFNTIKSAIKEMENKLYCELKDIAEKTLGPMVFVIPQMYSK